MDRLQGKIAVITGAAKGIGYETANRFVDEGAQVIMSDLNVELGEAASRNLGNACSFSSRTSLMNHPGMNLKIILKPIMGESIFSSITRAYWRPKQLRTSRRHRWRNGEPFNR